MQLLAYIMIFFVVFFYQQCAQYNFVEKTDSTSATIQEAPAEPEVELDGHGTIYTGKPTQYILADIEDKCIDSDILSMILREEDSFSIVREDCIDIPQRPIEREMIELLDQNQIVYNDQSFHRQIHPSCLAIHQAGLSSGNGSYMIDPDGEGGDDPFITYCEMDIIGGL